MKFKFLGMIWDMWPIVQFFWGTLGTALTIILLFGMIELHGTPFLIGIIGLPLWGYISHTWEQNH